MLPTVRASPIGCGQLGRCNRTDVGRCFISPGKSDHTGHGRPFRECGAPAVTDPDPRTPLAASVPGGKRGSLLQALGPRRLGGVACLLYRTVCFRGSDACVAEVVLDLASQFDRRVELLGQFGRGLFEVMKCRFGPLGLGLRLVVLFLPCRTRCSAASASRWACAGFLLSSFLRRCLRTDLAGVAAGCSGFSGDLPPRARAAVGRAEVWSSSSECAVPCPTPRPEPLLRLRLGWSSTARPRATDGIP